MSTRSLGLEYNTSRDKMIFSEYGRCIQKLIQHAKTLEDRDKRTKMITEIVELILFLNPQTKNVNEYKQKLWRHVYKIANFELDVDHPLDETPQEENTALKPQKVPYPQHQFNWRHYGYNIRVMIDKALKMEDGEVKQGYVETILSYMKLSFRTWNKEHFVSDDMIINDLIVLSGNQLQVADDHTIRVVTKSNVPVNENTFKPVKNKKLKPKPKQPMGQQQKKKINAPMNRQRNKK